MKHDREIAEGIFIIGGPDISHSNDATVFIIDCAGELVMIDSGAGSTTERLVKNIEGLGFDPHDLSTLILTHCHIDHIGGAPYFKETLDCKLVVHDLDADAIEQGNELLTGARMYGTVFPPTNVDKRLTGEHGILRFGKEEIHYIHTPGHTPGSISLYIDRGGKRVLFGQDIHGPFSPNFGSDIQAWKKSMQKLLDIKADILCEGHFGIFHPNDRVEAYIKSYLSQY